MIQRCTNPRAINYNNYGGRGITVCKRWRKFENFLEDMGEAPKGLQIDRIKNKKGYYKDNCQWVTSKQNCRNRKNNHLISFNGKVKCLTTWAEKTGINHHTIRNRLRRGWSVKKTLTTPVRTKRRKSFQDTAQ